MNTNTERRLYTLEAMFAPPACITCHHWVRWLLVYIDGDTNQEVSRSHPDICPTCGRTVHSFRELHIVGAVGDADVPEWRGA